MHGQLHQTKHYFLMTSNLCFQHNTKICNSHCIFGIWTGDSIIYINTWLKYNNKVVNNKNSFLISTCCRSTEIWKSPLVSAVKLAKLIVSWVTSYSTLIDKMPIYVLVCTAHNCEDVNLWWSWNAMILNFKGTDINQWIYSQCIQLGNTQFLGKCTAWIATIQDKKK